MRPGAWTGLIVATDSDVVRKSVTKERWKMVQSKVRWLAEHVNLKDEFLKDNSIGSTDDIEAPPGKIKLKTMERFVGFFVYVSQTYTSFAPYLKDIYVTLNSWHPGRDTDVW